MNEDLYRSRYLPAYSAGKIAAIPDKDRTPVILAVGAIEQHGPHLPVAVDALMGRVWTTLLLERLPAAVPCFVAPPVTVGKSNEHTGYPGTLMISKGSLRALLLAIAGQLRRWGFRRIAVINTHGGNVAVLIPTLREIREGLGLRAELLRSGPAEGISAQEAAYGIHAGEVETSWILAAAAPLVRMTEARCDYFFRVEDPGSIRPVGGPVIRAWATRDLSSSGILGDAAAADAEKGRRWLDAGAAGLAAQVEALYSSST